MMSTEATRLREVMGQFREEVRKWGWVSSGAEWFIEGVGERIYYSIRDYSNTVPTHVVEGDLGLLLSKISRAKSKEGVKAYGMILLSPGTTGPAERKVADQCEKVALLEVDLREGRGRRLDRTGSKVIDTFTRWLTETYGVEFEEVTWPFRFQEEVTPAPPRPAKVEEADIVGEPINFRGMVYAPLNEAGVILLFAKVMDDLGIIYESSPPGFPDMIGRRKVGNAWQRVRIEFEYKSSSFKQHEHDPTKCDIIVCWEHDWPDCPIEVIELRDVIRKLRPQ